MKFLKLFENYNEVLDYINDILIDLKDDGFEIAINPSGVSNNKHIVRQQISITIERSNRFKYSDIMPIVDRLTSYLKTEGYSKIGDNSNSFKNYLISNKDEVHRSYLIRYLEN